MNTRFQVSGFRFQVAKRKPEQRFRFRGMAHFAFNPKPETRNLKPLFAPLAVAALLTLWPFAVAAQVSTEQLLRDPMRPPAAIDAPASGKDAPSAAPLLQSVMIGSAERWAIIGGERVALGARYGDARVVAITESEVVLRSAEGTRTLRMYPDVVMSQVKPATQGAKKPATRKRTDRQ